MPLVRLEGKSFHESVAEYLLAGPRLPLTKSKATRVLVYSKKGNLKVDIDLSEREGPHWYKSKVREGLRCIQIREPEKESHVFKCPVWIDGLLPRPTEGEPSYLFADSTDMLKTKWWLTYFWMQGDLNLKYIERTGTIQFELGD